MFDSRLEHDWLALVDDASLMQARLRSPSPSADTRAGTREVLQRIVDFRKRVLTIRDRLGARSLSRCYTFVRATTPRLKQLRAMADGLITSLEDDQASTTK